MVTMTTIHSPRALLLVIKKCSINAQFQMLQQTTILNFKTLNFVS